MSELPTLHVCTTCRAGEPLPADGVAPGTHLFRALANAGHGMAVHPVECLHSCANGCTAAIAAPGKWTFLLGRLTPGMAGDVVAYALSYAASATGTVMPSRRPAALASAILGRTPGHAA